MSRAWPPRPILVIGASARAAVQSALRNHDRHILAADLFCDRDLASLVQSSAVDQYPQDFLDIVCKLRKQHPELAFLYTGAMENYPDLIAECAKVAPVLGNNAETVKAVRDPFRLSEVLEAHGFEFPELRRSLDDRAVPHEWLRKCFRSAGGQRVTAVAANSEEEQSAESGGVYYQKFVDGVPCSAAYVGDGERCQLIGISEMLVGCEWLGATGFQYCGSLERRPSGTEVKRWQNLGEVIRSQFELRGVFGVDAIVMGDQLHPIEINPRFTASMELFDGAASSVIDRHLLSFSPLTLADTRQIEKRPALQIKHDLRGKGILYAIDDTEFREDLTPLLTVDAELADVPQPQIIPAGYPMLTLLTSNSSPQALREKIQTAADQIYEILS